MTGGLEHPGIVPVYGLGANPEGRPYYAMRLIRGQNLREHIQRFHRERIEKSLPYDGVPLRKLLRRFLDVCDAISYAHARGVLHRDLKPGNVMLGPHGETLVVDWGLAKTLGEPNGKTAAANEAEALGEPALNEAVLRPSSNNAVATEIGSALGTIAYAPPEQLLGEQQDIGPLSDVYGLGAILYELLTDSPPVTSKNLPEAIEQATRGRIAPPRSVVAETPRRLEAICLRALARRPADRYASAAELQSDVERWLDDQPIAALPDGLVARVGRWLRRNRGVALTAVAAMLLLSIVASASAVVIEQARRREARLATANGQLADAERMQKERATAVTRFLVESLHLADPSRGGRDVKIVDILDQARRDAPLKFEGQPFTQSAIYDALGRAYSGLGELETAASLGRQALELDEEMLGPRAGDTMAARNFLATVLYKLSKIDEAETLLRQSLDLAGPEALSADLLNNHAEVQVTKGNYEEAREFFRLAAEKASSVQPVDAELLAVIPMNVARIDYSQGDFESAVIQYREAKQRLLDVFGKEHPMTLICLSNLASALSGAGREDEAIQLKLETIEIKNRVLGENHPDTLASKNNLAISYMGRGENEKAVPLFESVFEHTLEFMPPADPRRMDIARRLVRLHLDAGRSDRAAHYLTTIIAVHHDGSLPLDAGYLATVKRLARLRAEAGDRKAAGDVLQAAIQRLSKTAGSNHATIEELQALFDELTSDAPGPSDPPPISPTGTAPNQPRVQRSATLGN